MANYKRTLPQLNEDNEAFWTGGAKDELRIQRCQSCGHFHHPAVHACTRCWSRELAFEPVSGRGAIESYTVARHPWAPGIPMPFIYAFVRLDEQDDLRVVTNVVNAAPDAVTCDMRVKVVFEQDEDVWIPLFEPDGQSEDMA